MKNPLLVIKAVQTGSYEAESEPELKLFEIQSRRGSRNK
jgi:hypothetical protein